MKVVVEGCCHGELDQIYDVIGQLQEREGVTVDLLICCGDFQAVRDKTDLNSMAVPLKYREMGSFYKYYSGEKMAPVLTIFIGGNHEASNHLWELSYGGWVAPRIFYLGRAGVVRYGGLRIAGLSGIYKEGDYRKGMFERPPFSEGTKRSVYHVRSCDVFRLKQISGHVDIGLSHDWPLGIYHHGNKAQLLRKKPYFAEEMEAESLGSPAAMELLQHLSPDYWFSAHLHVKFAAVYRHDDGDESGVRVTKFLALDKCLPGRRYLQVLDIDAPSPQPYKLRYDAEWLAILRSTEPLMSYSRLLWLPPHPSTDSRLSYTPTSEEVDEAKTLFHGDLGIPDNFEHNSRLPENRQTSVYCSTLGINNPFSTNFSSTRMSLGSPGNSLHGNTSSAEISLNPDEIDLGDDSDDNEEEPGRHGDTSELTNEISAASNTSTPDRRRYPWLDENSPGDEQNQFSSGQTSSPAVVMENKQNQVQKYPLPDLERELQDRESFCLAGGEEVRPNVVPDPDRNPDEISLDEGEGEEGVNEGAKVNLEEEGVKDVKPAVVIRRRNMAIYQTEQDI